ncbi:unnamed protein product [Ectocarpus sp. 4 AP-2014]
MSPLEVTSCGTKLLERQWTYMRMAPQEQILTLFLTFQFLIFSCVHVVNSHAMCIQEVANIFASTIQDSVCPRDAFHTRVVMMAIGNTVGTPLCGRRMHACCSMLCIRPSHRPTRPSAHFLPL